MQDTRHDGGIGTNAYVITNLSAAPFGFIAPRRATTAERIVYEHYAVANKTIITNGHQLANEAVRLHLAPLADGNIFLYLYKRAYECVAAYFATIQVHRLHHGNIFTEYNIVLNGHIF